MNPQEQPLRLPPLADAGIRAGYRKPGPAGPAAAAATSRARCTPATAAPTTCSRASTSTTAFPIGDVAHGLPDYAAYLKYLNANAPWISAPAPRDTLRL